MGLDLAWDPRARQWVVAVLANDEIGGVGTDADTYLLRFTPCGG